jgi:hypothetical protein
MRYVLHIGTNKTGTSTLQHYLGTYRNDLLGQGIWYPEIGSHGYAHHDYAQAIKQADFNAHHIDPEAIRRPPKSCETVLLSSESFHTVKAVKDVARWFPPDCTTVVLYLREHVAYFASWYQQAVQARTITCSFPDFAVIQSRSMAQLADSWRAMYGDNLKVRVYDREQLLNGDIVSDFFSVVFDRPPPRERAFEDKNPSITGNLLFLKLILNHVLTAEENSQIVEELSTLARLESRFEGKFLVTEREATRIAHRNAQDRKHLKQHHGIAFKVPRTGIQGRPVPDLAALSDDIALMLRLSKERGFALYDIFKRKMDVLCPALD